MKISGWRARPISRAGKSIFIKNVAQALPSYCMMCFLLPKSLLQEIERMLNAYWWNSGSNSSKRVRWMGCGAMCEPNCKGGQGFKSLYGFNVALLGKHVWKCIQKPDLLVSRVLKARYFPCVHVLEASKGIHASFIWTSIWHAKEYLAKGFRWVVGDGQTIIAARDPWLSLKHNFKVDDLHRYVGRTETGSSLFYQGTKLWGVGRVRELFNNDDTKAILAAGVPQHTTVDRIVWLF